jgi:flavin-dependent dehydrogenase
VAALLAEQGARVLVLEKEDFPRFHIGESLLPAAELLTTVLGIDLDPSIFLFKRGAEFVCESTGRSQSFDFNEALPGPQRYAWHVDRARFDTVLRDRAREAGAEVRHGFSVADVALDGEKVDVRTSDGVEHARYFIDATGQDRLLARKMGSGRAFERFGKAAVFTHFSDLSERARRELSPGNDIRIVVIPDGWLWAIPLTGNRLSVGLVSRKAGLRKERLDEYLESSELFGRLTAGTTRHQTRLIGNFSFENTLSSGPRYTCVGDSACFIDPVFSSGVSLAIFRAVEVAGALMPALAAGREAEPDLMKPMETGMKRAYDTFAAMVHRFYNTNFVTNVILGAPADGRHRAGVISVLAGDVFRHDNPFQEMLLRARRLPYRRKDASGPRAHPMPAE